MYSSLVGNRLLAAMALALDEKCSVVVCEKGVLIEWLRNANGDGGNAVEHLIIAAGLQLTFDSVNAVIKPA